jgi:hypothetical protein
MNNPTTEEFYDWIIQQRGDHGIENLRRIPHHMHDVLARYILKGIEPGNFMTALMSNDLMETYNRADDKNIAAMRDWVVLVYSDLPMGCSGSKDKVNEWCRRGGLDGEA